MKLRGIEFGRAWNASGAMNFFGEGWPFHDRLGSLRPRFDGTTFVSKTTTLLPRVGNLPLDGTRPRSLFPDCVRVNWRRAAVLNAVGLSGPGMDSLMADGRWQARTEPFVLSIAGVGQTPEARAGEMETFARTLDRAACEFRAPFAIELNLSCPNTGHDQRMMIDEARDWVDRLAIMTPRRPVIVKVSATLEPGLAAELAFLGRLDAISVSNTIPWGAFPDAIDWNGLFGEVSPLAHIGGGGLSGAPIFPVVLRWLRLARIAGLDCPIIAGGGIMRGDDAKRLWDAGADAVSIGSVAILRPWRIAGIVRAIQGEERALH